MESTVNEAETGPGSVTMVLPGFSLDLETTRRQLIAKRNSAGANTPIGHRCSNLIEQLENLQTATGDQRTHLIASIQKSMAGLA